MIDLGQVQALAATGLEGVAGVASRWDVIGAAFLGGFLREVVTRRRHAAEADKRAEAIASKAAESAVGTHAAACVLRTVAAK